MAGGTDDAHDHPHACPVICPVADPRAGTTSGAAKPHPDPAFLCPGAFQPDHRKVRGLVRQRDLARIFTPVGQHHPDLAALSPELARRLGLNPQMQGVVVVDGPRRVGRAGLAVGDVILAVDGVAMTDPARLARLAKEHRGWWRIDLIRGNRRITLRSN